MSDDDLKILLYTSIGSFFAGILVGWLMATIALRQIKKDLAKWPY